MSGSRRLHVVSWNCAGWRTALEEVTRTTRTGPKGADVAGDRQACLREWLARLDADVVCLQEVKVKSGDVGNDARALCASADDGAWETFWACNDGRGDIGARTRPTDP